MLKIHENNKTMYENRMKIYYYFSFGVIIDDQNEVFIRDLTSVR